MRVRIQQQHLQESSDNWVGYIGYSLICHDDGGEEKKERVILDTNNIRHSFRLCSLGENDMRNCKEI